MPGISLLFWGCALLLNPLGNHPLNDDWAYALAAQRLLSGRFEPSHYVTVPLLAQAGWGALFCLPAGFSHGALRLSTLAAAWLGALAFHATLRRLGAGRAAAAAGAASLLWNPLYFVLSFTFMTDVHALAWMLFSGYAFLRGLQEEDPRWLALGSALSGTAYLVRQPGLCMALGAAPWLLRRGRGDYPGPPPTESSSSPGGRASGIRPPCGGANFQSGGLSSYARGRALAAALAPALAIALLHQAWQAWAGPTYAFRHYAVSALRMEAFPSLLPRLAGTSLLLGLFLLPWAAALRSRGRSRGAAAALAALWAALLLAGRTPATGNVVGRFGLGTCTLGESCAFKASGIFGWPPFWTLAAAAGLAAAAWLAWRAPWRDPRPRGPLGAYCLGFGLAFLPALLNENFFDRYALVLFPPAIAMLASSGASWRRFLPAQALLALWSVLGASDYLAWNRAKWGAGERLEALGIPRDKISNGLEWDATYGYENRMEELLRTRRVSDIRPYDWLDSSRYRALTSFAPRSNSPDLERVGEVGYRTPLSFKEEFVTMWVRRSARSP